MNICFALVCSFNYFLMYCRFVASFVVYALILAAGEFSENLYLSEALPTLFEYPTLIFLWVVLGKPWWVKRT